MTHPSAPPDPPAPHDDAELLARREVLAILVAGVACSSPDNASTGASHEAKAPMPHFNAATLNAYWRKLPDGTLARYTGRRDGDVVVAGQKLGRYVGGRADKSASTSAEVWVNVDETTKVTFGGAAYESEAAGKLGVPSRVSATLETPLTLDMDVPLGQPQPFDSKVIVAVSTTTQTAKVPLEGSFTVVEKDVTVQTQAGAVSGCTHIKGEARVPLVFGTSLVTARGEMWVSPTRGIVKATLLEPLSGLGADADEMRASHDLGGGFASVEAIGVLGQVGKGVSRFELSTTEASGGAFDADKTVHAKMLLEIRWLDDAKAKTQDKPYVETELGTVFGVFPASLEASPVSFLHPEENGRGYTTWIAYADQAAKNEPGSNGIAYHTAVKYDPSFSPIRVSSRVVYKRYAP